VCTILQPWLTLYKLLPLKIQSRVSANVNFRNSAKINQHSRACLDLGNLQDQQPATKHIWSYISASRTTRLIRCQSPSITPKTEVWPCKIQFRNSLKSTGVAMFVSTPISKSIQHPQEMKFCHARFSLEIWKLISDTMCCWRAKMCKTHLQQYGISTNK
jgi:hypothetical protein